MSQIATGFGFQSTAADVAEGVDLGGRRAIVTGGASGIGIETARELARAGAAVTLAVRDTDSGERAAAAITATTGNPDITVSKLDLADLESIAAFVQAWDEPLDLLINNAGVMAIPDLRLTPQGWELQFATNHLGHFALATGLHNCLAAASGGARVVSLSSVAHLHSPVTFDDINFGGRSYDPMLAYAQSKTANVLFAVEATRRWAADGIMANAVHPGAVERTNLSRHFDPTYLHDLRASGVYSYKTPEQGAATSILIATSPRLQGIGGRYFEDCNEAPVIEPGSTPNARFGVARYAIDPTNAMRLWDLSQDNLS